MMLQYAFENLGGEAANDKTRRVVRSARSANRIVRAFYDGEALLAATAGLRQIKGDANKPVRSVAAGSAAPKPGGEADAKPALPDAAVRALAEVTARRRERGSDPAAAKPATEVDGRGGLDPARYGDWEVNGLASDF